MSEIRNHNNIHLIYDTQVSETQLAEIQAAPLVVYPASTETLSHWPLLPQVPDVATLLQQLATLPLFTTVKWQRNSALRVGATYLSNPEYQDHNGVQLEAWYKALTEYQAVRPLGTCTHTFSFMTGYTDLSDPSSYYLDSITIYRGLTNKPKPLTEQRSAQLTVVTHRPSDTNLVLKERIATALALAYGRAEEGKCYIYLPDEQAVKEFFGSELGMLQLLGDLIPLRNKEEVENALKESIGTQNTFLVSRYSPQAPDLALSVLHEATRLIMTTHGEVEVADKLQRQSVVTQVNELTLLSENVNIYNGATLVTWFPQDGEQ